MPSGSRLPPNPGPSCLSVPRFGRRWLQRPARRRGREAGASPLELRESIALSHTPRSQPPPRRLGDVFGKLGEATFPGEPDGRRKRRPAGIREKNERDPDQKRESGGLDGRERAARRRTHPAAKGKHKSLTESCGRKGESCGGEGGRREGIGKPSLCDPGP